jgi:hypothetical protein
MEKSYYLGSVIYSIDKDTNIFSYNKQTCQPQLLGNPHPFHNQLGLSWKKEFNTMTLKWDKIKCTNYKLKKEKFETDEKYNLHGWFIATRNIEKK